MYWLRTGATNDARTYPRVVMFGLVLFWICFWFSHSSMLRVEGQVLYLYCCDLAPTVESLAVSRPTNEMSDLQHDGNHGDRCKAIRRCATESGKGEQEACE